MTKIVLLAAGLILIANFAVLLIFRDVVKSTHLFITSNTVLYPLACLNLAVGILAIIAFIRQVWPRRN